METFEVRSGYSGRNETLRFRNPVDIAEMVSYCNSRSHIAVRDRNGNWRRVKVNGAVRTWKRDPQRIEVPCKYGMYEYFTLTTRDINDVLIPVKDYMDRKSAAANDKLS